MIQSHSKIEQMNSNVRKIIHLDLDAFFCAVEEQRDPTLIGKAFAVGGNPEHRGVVSSCSYPARAYGVRSAMPMGRALGLCPSLIVVSPHYDAYGKASRTVMGILREVTPLVEQLSIDEAFLDVTDLPDYATTIARQLQRRILHEVGLPCSLGVATNKLVAKIATDVGKASARARGQTGSPNAITVVRPGTEAEFLAPLPASALWGVGPKTEARLEAFGITTIGDIAVADPHLLESAFGKNGAEISVRSRGVDTRPVVTKRRAKSISQETTFSVDTADETYLRKTMQKQAKQVAKSLKKKNLTVSTVKIKLRWTDFTTLTRQKTLAAATNDFAVINQAAQDLFRGVWERGRPVRLLGVGVSGLAVRPKQLRLFDENSRKEWQLLEAVDDIQKRFGEKIIHQGMPTKEEKSDG